MKWKREICNLIISVFILVMVSTGAAQTSDGQDVSSGPTFLGESLLRNASFIMDFSYIFRNVTDDELNTYQIPFFVDPGTQKAQPGDINLNYGELAADINVDRNFALFFDFIFTKESFLLDELYANTASLPYGFKFKVGRFLSNFGLHNKLHKHQWSFFDAPLVQRAFFGDRGLLEDAFQVGWEVPVDFFMLIGIEVGKGENSQSLGTDTFGPSELGVKKSKYPNLYTLFIDSNVTASNLKVTWGLSLASGNARIKGNLETNSGTGVYGDTFLGGFDLGFKYNFDKFSYIEWQNELIYRSIKGSLFQGEQGNAIPTIKSITKNQIGAYTQLVVKPFEYWRLGARAEILRNNIKLQDADKKPPENLMKFSGMLDFNPTEYTQIRLQFNYNKEYYDSNNNQVNVQEFIIQFNFSPGPHGAHII